MLTRIVDNIEVLNNKIGRAVAWLTLVMVLVTFVVVTLRYLFGTGWIWHQESVTWMHAAVFMLAASWTLAQDGHVRVDIFYRRAAPRRQAMVNALGTVFFLLPLAFLFLWTSWDYVQVSWEIRESSRETGGLPWPFPSLLKSIIPVTAMLLAMQGLVILIRSLFSLGKDADPSSPGPGL